MGNRLLRMVGEVNILKLNPFGLFLERSPIDTLHEKAGAMVDEACGCECETCKPDPKDYEE